MPARSESGQLLVPMAGLLVAFGLFCAGYVTWCRGLYWRMRMDMIADATALSAARAQAQMLNRLSFANLAVNRYIRKVRIPFTDHQIGEMSVKDYAAFVKEVRSLRNQVQGFKTYPAAVGRVVARENGAEWTSFYLPYPMESHLVPKTVHVVIHSIAPPALYFRTVEGAYYARAWKPGYLRAQPPHRTTWLVRGHGFQSMATGRLWLDVPNSSLTHNGGFPRVREGLIHDALVQSWFPHFNARLAPRSGATPEQLVESWRRQGGRP